MDNLWIIYVSGWWFVLNPSEKYELVNWDDEIPKSYGNIIQSCSSQHQADWFCQTPRIWDTPTLTAKLFGTPRGSHFRLHPRTGMRTQRTRPGIHHGDETHQGVWMLIFHGQSEMSTNMPWKKCIYIYIYVYDCEWTSRDIYATSISPKTSSLLCMSMSSRRPPELAWMSFIPPWDSTKIIILENYGCLRLFSRSSQISEDGLFI